MPHKAIQGKHVNSVPHCATEAQFLFNLEHFLLMFPRQEQEEQQQQENKSSFRTFERCSRSKIVVPFTSLLLTPLILKLVNYLLYSSLQSTFEFLFINVILVNLKQKLLKSRFLKKL